MLIVSESEFALRLGAALICGLLVGLDREIKHKPLGAGSFVLISVGSAAWTMVTINFALQAGEAHADIGGDPTRVVQGLIGAIVFLGAGAIISRNDAGRLRGVASGAPIWGTAAIGVACGLGYFFEAGLTAITFFTVLNVYGAIERIGAKNE